MSKDIFPACQSLNILETAASPRMCLELIVHNQVSRARGDKKKTLSSRIMWDDNLANVYIHNLSRNLDESELLHQRIEFDCDIHSVTALITSCMVNAADFLKKTFTARGTQKQSKQWFDGHCYAANKSVRRHLRKYLRTRSAADRSLYVKKTEMCTKVC